jgi:hypothetical protein
VVKTLLCGEEMEEIEQWEPAACCFAAVASICHGHPAVMGPIDKVAREKGGLVAAMLETWA